MNTNAAVLGEFLSGLGLPVGWAATVGDDIHDIAAAVLEGVRRAAVVVVCGGLGPTQDDLTREGLALAAGVAMDHDPGLDRQLRGRPGRPRRADVPAMNLRMADLPRGARALTNSAGTAPASGCRSATGSSTHCPACRASCAPCWPSGCARTCWPACPDLPAVVRRTVRTVGLGVAGGRGHGARGDADPGRRRAADRLPWPAAGRPGW